MKEGAPCRAIRNPIGHKTRVTARYLANVVRSTDPPLPPHALLRERRPPDSGIRRGLSTSSHPSAVQHLSEDEPYFAWLPSPSPRTSRRRKLFLAANRAISSCWARRETLRLQGCRDPEIAEEPTFGFVLVGEMDVGHPQTMQKRNIWDIGDVGERRRAGGAGLLVLNSAKEAGKFRRP